MDFETGDWLASMGYKDHGGGIYVGSDVWVGRGSRLKAAGDTGILTIGDGAVIAADSVVVRDVPPYAVVGGNPAKIIKYRFSPEMIDAFLRLRWWDWSIEKIHENLDIINDPRAFLKRHGY
jgi:chloramphenicol O-acetyltransferase